MSIKDNIIGMIEDALPLDEEILVVWPGGYQVAGPGGSALESVINTARRFATVFSTRGHPRDNPGAIFQHADLKACTDATVPGCPGCTSDETIMIETTAGNWQLLCLNCLGRWGTTWRPSDRDDP